MKIEDFKKDIMKNPRVHSMVAKLSEEDYNFIIKNNLSIGKIITEVLKEFKSHSKEEINKNG